MSRQLIDGFLSRRKHPQIIKARKRWHCDGLVTSLIDLDLVKAVTFVSVGRLDTLENCGRSRQPVLKLLSQFPRDLQQQTIHAVSRISPGSADLITVENDIDWLRRIFKYPSVLMRDDRLEVYKNGTTIMS